MSILTPHRFMLQHGKELVDGKVIIGGARRAGMSTVVKFWRTAGRLAVRSSRRYDYFTFTSVCGRGETKRG